MEFILNDLEREPIDFDLALESLDLGEEASLIAPLKVSGRAEAIHEHHEAKQIVSDIRLKGGFAGLVEVPCARCLEPVRTPLAAEFDLIFRPSGTDQESGEREISAPETEIGYYQEGSLSLEDVLREQVLLSLPARSLCKPDCKGLCPSCGKNRNLEACSCEEGPKDPRWEALAGLRARMKS